VGGGGGGVRGGPLADPLDGGRADLQGFSDRPVGPGGAALGGVGLEQDAGVGQLPGGGPAGGDQVVQGLAFLGVERDLVSLHGGPPVAVSAPGEPIWPQSAN